MLFVICFRRLGFIHVSFIHNSYELTNLAYDIVYTRVRPQRLAFVAIALLPANYLRAMNTD